MLGNELEIDGLAVPAVETEDAVCFLDDSPAFDVGEGAAGLFALLDVVGIERRCKRRILRRGKPRGATVGLEGGAHATALSSVSVPSSCTRIVMPGYALAMCSAV